MARLDPLPDDAVSFGTRIWFRILRRVFGAVPRPYRIIGRVPRVVSAFVLANGALETGHWAIGRELSTLIHLRVAMLVGCVF